jgi:transcriptional regulator with XRE-family HTH domain
MPHNRKVPDHNRYFGQRIREARIANKMSQQELAEHLGLSFQQVQKYENGINRVSSAQIERLVTALNRPIAYFFPNASDVRAAPIIGAFLATKNGQRLAAVWPELSPSDQLTVVKLAEHLAQDC